MAYIGYSRSEHTQAKQLSFRKMIDLHMQITLNIVRKHSGWAKQSYRYFDLNAGPGIDPITGELGSPLIALEKANAIWKDDYEMDFFEIDPISYFKLRRAILSPNVRVFNCNNELVDNFLPDGVDKTQYGLVYADPSAAPRLAIEPMGAICDRFPKVDAMFNIAATSIKRANSTKPPEEILRLDDMRARINKKHWIIRKPISQFQWTILLGTNWLNYPDWEKNDFVSIHSDLGKEWLAICNLSERERQRAIQPTLF